MSERPADDSNLKKLAEKPEDGLHHVGGDSRRPSRMLDRRESFRHIKYDVKLFSGTANLDLTRAIAKNLQMEMADIEVGHFSDGEIRVQVLENIRGADVFLVQPTCYPVNDHLMELLIILDALKRASAGRITAVLPYYGYARQDRKAAPRVPISAKLVADLLTCAGASRVLTLELHAGQIQGFFNIPVDHLYATDVFVQHVRDEQLKDLVVVSPDAGGVERARQFAKKINASIAICDKRRDPRRPNEAHIINLVGDVRNKDCVIIDDIIDTAGTVCEASKALSREGAKRILVCAVHPVLSGPAIQRIDASPIEQLVVTDTIPLAEDKRRCSKIRVLTVSHILAEAIRRIHAEQSVSSLFA